MSLIEAMRALGRHYIVLITHELTEECRALLRERVIDAIIDQNPEFEVRMALETVARHFGRMEKPLTRA